MAWYERKQDVGNDLGACFLNLQVVKEKIKITRPLD